jgi:hypothetical protein
VSVIKFMDFIVIFEVFCISFYISARPIRPNSLDSKADALMTQVIIS